jgi:hypothetical protein
VRLYEPFPRCPRNHLRLYISNPLLCRHTRQAYSKREFGIHAPIGGSRRVARVIVRRSLSRAGVLGPGALSLGSGLGLTCVGEAECGGVALDWVGEREWLFGYDWLTRRLLVVIS